MKRKILLSMAAAGTALSILPLLAAFEAHVINVTARIENALAVPLEHIRFGTVFPQEYLERELPIRLSQSFLEEERVDDVEYFIRQKPKCVITRNDGTAFNEQDPTATGHVMIGDNPATDVIEESWIDCGPTPRLLVENETWGVLPSLCPYLSKHERSTDGTETENDGSLSAFHRPYVISTSTGTTSIVWTEVEGRLSKLAQDIADLWIVDLAVPCFGGHCAQDWDDFVLDHNATANPAEFTQPIENEHKLFGCDLWIEVSEVSRATTTPPTPPPPPPADTIAPTTSILAPVEDTTVSGTTTILASASDNVGVTSVEFLVDDVVKFTATSSPYSFEWETTNGGTHACIGPHTHTLMTRAYDAAANVGTSTSVVVAMNNPPYCP